MHNHDVHTNQPEISPNTTPALSTDDDRGRWWVPGERQVSDTGNMISREPEQGKWWEQTSHDSAPASVADEEPDKWWLHAKEQTPAAATPDWWEMGNAPSNKAVARPDTPPRPDFPKGAENPFNGYVASVMDCFSGLDLAGEAEVLSQAWVSWRDSGIDAQFRRRREEPEKTQKISYGEIASKGQGWKFHLNFDAEDPAKVQIVGMFLAALDEHGAISSFKVGHGGGKRDGAPGKEATVYVGHRDKAEVLAPILEEGLRGLLDAPEGDALADDIHFTQHVLGRFEIGVIDSEFHQYGAKGHPILEEDVRKYLAARHSLSENERAELSAGAPMRAERVLRQRYGAFYMGTRL